MPDLRMTVLATVAALALGACEATGPRDRAAFEAQAATYLPATDNVPITVARVRYLNARTIPSFSASLLLGARATPMLGAAVLTSRTLYILYWNDRQRAYTTYATIPLAAVVEAKHVQAPLGSGIEVETRDPMYLRLGQPEQTGLFHMTVIPTDGLVNDGAGTTALAQAIERAVQAARAGLPPTGGSAGRH